MKKIKLLYENVTILKKICLNWKEVSVGSLININSLLKSSLCLSHFNSKDVSHSCAVRRLWRLDRRADGKMRAGWASVSRSASYSYLCYWYAGIFKVARMESTFPSTINPETKRWNRVLHHTEMSLFSSRDPTPILWCLLALACTDTDIQIKSKNIHQGVGCLAWWQMPIIPALRRQKRIRTSRSSSSKFEASSQSGEGWGCNSGTIFAWHAGGPRFDLNTDVGGREKERERKNEKGERSYR